MLPMCLIGRLGGVLTNPWRLLMLQSALPNRRDVRVGQPIAASWNHVSFRLGWERTEIVSQRTGELLGQTGSV